MNMNVAQQTADYIMKDIFGVDRPFPLPHIIERFAFDIPSVQPVRCALSGEEIWTFFPTGEKIASQKAIADRFKKDEWMREKKSLTYIQDVLRSWNEINYLTGEKYIHSRDVSESDGIYNSSGVHRSVSVFDSKHIVASYKLFDSQYMLASRDCSSCNVGIRMKESIFCSSGFEISWSHKVSRSMYIHDCFDVYECLFCSHLRSKKYCIANMQYGKEEYVNVKKLVIDWILRGKEASRRF